MCGIYIVCTSNLDLVSFLFVPALYSPLKMEIFPFTCILIAAVHVLVMSLYKQLCAWHFISNKVYKVLLYMAFKMRYT